MSIFDGSTPGSSTYIRYESFFSTTSIAGTQTRLFVQPALKASSSARFKVSIRSRVELKVRLVNMTTASYQVTAFSAVRVVYEPPRWRPLAIGKAAAVPTGAGQIGKLPPGRL